MTSTSRILIIALSLSIATSAFAAKVNFSDPMQSTDAFVRLRADASGKESVTYWKGSMFVVLPGEAPKRTFGFEGFNVARMVKQKDGTWQMITREYSVYRDLKTGSILKTWDNPHTNSTVTVFDVQNDPVNQTFGNADPSKAFAMPWLIAGDQVQLGFDVPLSYPNPIDPKIYPKHAQNAMYTGSEHFGFFASKKDLENAKLTSVPIQISWSRTSPWLPWMEMGDRAGFTMFTAWGRKLNSINELAPDLIAHVKANDAKFLSAPKDYLKPNATTWTEYRRMVLEAKE